MENSRMEIRPARFNTSYSISYYKWFCEHHNFTWYKEHNSHHYVADRVKNKLHIKITASCHNPFDVKVLVSIWKVGKMFTRLCYPMLLDESSHSKLHWIITEYIKNYKTRYSEMLAQEIARRQKKLETETRLLNKLQNKINYGKSKSL